MRLPHNNPQESVAGPNQRNLKSNVRKRDDWSTMKRSGGLKRSWWGPRRTKRSGKKGRKRLLCVLRSFFHSKLCTCFDKRLSRKNNLRWNAQRSRWLNARNKSRAWWSVLTIFFMNLSLPRTKQFICARFFQICRQERTRTHLRKEETRLTFGLVSTKRRSKQRLTKHKVP